MTTHSSNLAWRIPWTEEPGYVMLTAPMQGQHLRTTGLLAALVVKNPPIDAADIRDGFNP